MIKITYRLLTIALLICLSTTGVRAADPVEAPAEADLSILLNTIRANRRALVSVNLSLTEEESAKFWPLYEQYQQEINPTGDRMAAVVEDYTKNFAGLADDKALQLVKDYAAADAERLTVRRKYIDEFAKILPGRKVARFFQIENKMDAVIRYDLAATIPVVEEGSGGTK